MPEISIMVGAGGTSVPQVLKDALPPGTVIKAGDTKHIWNRDNPDEVEGARTLFNTLTSRGYTAFKAVGEKGEKGKKLDSFDPAAERMILVPRIAGGANGTSLLLH